MEKDEVEEFVINEISILKEIYEGAKVEIGEREIYLYGPIFEKNLLDRIKNETEWGKVK